jgi:hypothetical protein
MVRSKDFSPQRFSRYKALPGNADPEALPPVYTGGRSSDECIPSPEAGNELFPISLISLITSPEAGNELTQPGTSYFQLPIHTYYGRRIDCRFSGVYSSVVCGI